jgi:hypothetical protein
VVVVVVVVVGAAVVVVVVGDSATVVVVSGGSVVLVGRVDVVDVEAGRVVDGTSPVTATVTVVVVVGAPIASGVSTTRARIPATAVDAISTDKTVAPSHATPKPTIRFIRTSMHQSARC